MKSTLPYQTLHSHTLNSDGTLSHMDVIDVCQQNNIGVVAFTDHDSLPDKKTIRLLKKFSNNPVKWIVGIEMSSDWPLDLGGGSTSGLHIVGLFVDPLDNNLLDHCTKARHARVERMQRMVKNLKSLGFKISQNDCLKASRGESVGRPHIVEALGYYKENEKVMRGLRKRMKEDSKNNSILRKKYQQMIKDGKQQFPYVLFLSDDSYIDGVYVNYLYSTDFDANIKLIRGAGGLAILAHWFTCMKKLDEKYLDKVLASNRLDGLETVFGIGPGGVMDKKLIEEYRRVVVRLTRANNSLEAGGFDAHKKRHFELFNSQNWYAKRTIGMIEKIMAKTKVNSKWSNI